LGVREKLVEISISTIRKLRIITEKFLSLQNLHRKLMECFKGDLSCEDVLKELAMAQEIYYRYVEMIYFIVFHSPEIEKMFYGEESLASFFCAPITSMLQFARMMQDTELKNLFLANTHIQASSSILKPNKSQNK
jgi:hypothetical protein